MAEALTQSPRATGLLMAGGESRRMGRDKAMLVFQGEPLWARQWRTLREAGAGEVLIARAELPWVEVEGLTKVGDARTGRGPLGGLVGALRRLETRWLLVLAVDLPLMRAEFLRGVLEMAERGACGVVPMIDGRDEPLAAVYSKTCLPVLESSLETADWSLQRLMKACVESGAMRAFEVGEDDRRCFRNVNTPDDFVGLAAALDNSRRSVSRGGAPT